MYLVCSSFILLTITHSGIFAQELIGPTPENQAVLLGSDHTLTCRRGVGGDDGSVIFQDTTEEPVVTLCINGVQQWSDTINPKYSNFNSDPDNNPYDVVITNIQVEDEGKYACQNPIYGLTISVTRTVEVPLSSFELSQNGSPTSLVTVQAGVPSELVCSAVGARPAVTIEWHHKTVTGSETQITDGINQKDTPTGDTTDSVSTLTYTATKDYNGGSLRCVTSGQIVAPREEATASMNVQYIPFVEVDYGGDKVTCTSDANPTVTMVKIFVNDTLEYSPTCEGTTCTLPLKVDYDTDVRCNAINTIGTGTATTVAVPGGPLPTTPTPTVTGTTKKSGVKHTINIPAIILGVFLLFSVICNVASLYYIYRLLKNKHGSQNGGVKESSTPNVPQTYMELNQQTRQPESTYEQPKTNDPKDTETAHAYMDLNPHTQDEKTAYQDLNPTEKSLQGAGNSAYEEIQETKNTQAYVNVKVDRPQKAK